MGDRVNIYFKQFVDDEAMILLYSHNGGSEVDEWLSAAVEHARPRWLDTFYGTRMIISHIIGQEWNSEHGFGLATDVVLRREENGYRVVDFINHTVSDDLGNGYTFEEYVNKTHDST